MISRLQGTILEKKPPILVVDVQGVGYELAMPLSCLSRLTQQNNDVIIYTHLSIREDGHFLFGFSDVHTRDTFRMLIKVSGVGPKMALAILSHLSAAQLYQVIQDNNISRFMKTPGIGKKTAERLMIELRDKLQISEFAASISKHAKNNDNESQSVIIADAIAALESLGYKNTQAVVAVKHAFQPQINLETLIRQALQYVI